MSSPQQALLGGSGDAAADTYWSDVVLLASCDGTNGSTSFTDKSTAARTLTAVAGAIVSTSTAKYGTGSLYVNSGSDYLSAADSADWDFGSGDFTIECYIYRTSLPAAAAYPGIMSQRSTGSSQFAWTMYLNGDSSGIFRFDYSTTGSSMSGSATSGAPTASTWSHVAVSRVGSDLRCFTDGIAGTVHNIGAATLFNSTEILAIGRLSATLTANFFGGFIDEIRITKGVGRYTSDFTPPSAPFPAS
jgi:hypothetical protein